MKKLYIIFTSIFLCLASCEKEVLSVEVDSINLEKSDANETNRSFNSLDYPSNQMIVQYDNTLSETEKQQMRSQYGVENYKNCTCADPTLELWIFSERDPSNPGFNLEEKVPARHGPSTAATLTTTTMTTNAIVLDPNT